jgi:acyl carrier protein
MASDTFERVRAVVCKELNVNESEVNEGASFTEDLGADSLDVVELVMALEEEFGIDIPDDDVANIKTVGDVVTYISGKV